MVWCWFLNGDRDHPISNNNSSSNAVVTVVRAVVVAVMGCLFGCFKVKDVNNLPPPLTPSSDSLSHQSLPVQEPLVSRNRSPLSTHFAEEVENQNSDTPTRQLDTNELRNQAKFLKACGTLTETPVEIRNASVKCKDLSAQMEEIEPLKFHSAPSDATSQELNLNSLPDQPTHMKIYGVKMQSGSLVHTPSSCLTDGQSFSKSSIDGSGNSNTPTSVKVNGNVTHNGNTASPITAPTTQYRYRSVRFESEPDVSSMSSKCVSSATSQDSKQSQFSGDYNVSKYSPYPTPLKLTEAMQTPGTVFPACLDNFGIAKTARIRSQYVYPVLNPVDDPSQLKELSDEDSYSTQYSTSRLLFSNSTDSDQRSHDEENIMSEETSKSRESSAEKVPKPPLIDEVQSKLQSGSVYGEKVHYGKTGDRPIIGLVATHWNDDETSRISPKWWDGNGIPNSTTKYKEDQKVRWHATPFEERLEKALSNETNISDRNNKLIVTTPPIALSEIEESDSPTSQIHK